MVLPEDLSAIIDKQDKSNDTIEHPPSDDNGSEDDKNLADLNRKLMPSFIVMVGNKAIKMPFLDFSRVLCPFDSKPFLHNLKA